MLKFKALFTALLLILSLKTFATCYHNQTSKSIFIASLLDWYGTPYEIKPGGKYCTDSSFAGIYAERDGTEICAILSDNFIIGAENIYVVQVGEHKTCRAIDAAS